MFLLFTLSGYAAGYKGLTTGGWQIRFDDQKGGVSLYKKSKNICEGLYASLPYHIYTPEKSNGNGTEKITETNRTGILTGVYT